MTTDLIDVVGNIPYRMAFAGGWIDQPFMSRLNPEPPGSMVTVRIEPDNFFMERSGMATGTRRVVKRLWGDGIPDGDPAALVRELYAEENKDQPEPSGSQDMIGLIYDGVCQLDYDASHEDGYFPVHIEQCNDRDVADWLERVVYMLPVAPRPAGYNPLTRKNLDPEWVQRLGQTGKDCYDAIVARDAAALGASMNDCMLCWETLLPDIVQHDALMVDLKAVMEHYQARYPGAMFSGCGGGYLYIVSEEPVPGAFTVSVRTGKDA
ncbi:MAG: hypothetical protein QGH42_08215 [Kiritimatiellia bacterium]|jgi:hypothetical protein|nr:hypothetical protein [Pseudomonadales bacterium]MDP6630359.1 hypothetical protein [Kiritimatiellia bacterium]MDP6810865.1 hypothetical protein [Kiritimatiellia bacterium]MDP7024208.1 hypothetical protein [Kiritimatiellia bacterium]